MPIGEVRFRLGAFYERFNPDDANKVDKLLGNIAGGAELDEVLSKMCAKYTEQGAVVDEWVGPWRAKATVKVMAKAKAMTMGMESPLQLQTMTKGCLTLRLRRDVFEEGQLVWYEDRAKGARVEGRIHSGVPSFLVILKGGEERYCETDRLAPRKEAPPQPGSAAWASEKKDKKAKKRKQTSS
eukprot:gene31973-64136_t